MENKFQDIGSGPGVSASSNTVIVGGNTAQSQNNTPKFVRPKNKSIRGRVALGLAVVGALAIGIAIAINVEPKSQQSVGSRFNTTEIPLENLASNETSTLIGTRSLVINGSLQANDSFIIAPSAQPLKATAGQIYFDQTSTQLAYYNGTQFIPVGGQLTGGNGITNNAGVLVNTGVLSIQGQTGDVAFTAGDGITITGTTFNNSGVITASAGAGITVTNDGNGNIVITNSEAGSGSDSVDTTGGTVGRIAKFTGAQTVADSLLSESGTTITVNGGLTVTGASTLSGTLAVTGATTFASTVSVTGALTLTTALTVANGGTGASSLTANGVVIAHGTSPLTSATSGLAGECLMSTAGAPAFGTCPGGGGGGVTGTGTNNRITKFTTTGSTVGDSSISDDGTTVTTSVDVVIQGGDLTVGTTSQAASLLLHDGNGQTTTLQAGNSTGNLTFVLPTTAGIANQCLKQTGVANQLTWQDCDGGSGGSSATLQIAYGNGGSITTTDARDIDIVLADTTTDANLDIVVADGSSGFVSITRANGTGTADPAQLLMLDNLDLTRSVNVGLKIQSAAGGIVTALDLTDSDIVTAISVGVNDIAGTTGNIDFSNFDVTGSSGNITTAGDLAVNGGDITSTGGLTILSGGAGDITIDAAGSDISLLDPTVVTGNITSKDASTPTKQGRLKTSGSTVDLEGTGADMHFSTWTGTDFTGTQRKHLIMLNGSDTTIALGEWDWYTSEFGSLHNSISSIHTRFNLDQQAADFSVAGDTDASLLYVKGFGDSVGIGTNAPGYKLDVNGTLGVAGLVTLTTTGTANTATHLCLNGSNQIATCNSTGSGAAFVQGGNSFGATATLGTNDANDLAIERNNATQLTVGNGVVTFASNVDLTLQGATAFISNPQGLTTSEFFGSGSTFQAGSTANVTVFGSGSKAGDRSVSFGSTINNTANDTVAIGHGITITSASAIAIGSGTSAASESIAFGTASAASFANSIAFGDYSATTAANQLVIGSSNDVTHHISQVYIGSGVTDTTPNGVTLNATGGSGTNIAGASFTIAGGQGTGTGNGGNVSFQIAKPGTTGTSANTLASVLTLSGINGAATFQSATDSTSAFRILNTAGTGTAFNADTTNLRVGIGIDTPTSKLHVFEGTTAGASLATFRDNPRTLSIEILAIAGDAGLIRGGSADSLGFAANNNSTAHLTINTAGDIVIGASDTTGALLILDTKTGSGDPTGVAGGMYYNSNLGQFRCYEVNYWRDCGTDSARTTYRYVNDFIGSSTDSSIDFFSTAGGFGSRNAEAKHPGMLYMDTGSSATTLLWIVPRSNSTMTTLLGNSDYWQAEAVMRIPSGSSALSTGSERYIFRTGFIDDATANSGDGSNGCFFRYSDNVNSGKWQGVCRTAATESTCDTTTTVATNTWYRLTLAANTAGTSVDFKINGTSLCQVTTNIPTASNRQTGWGTSLLKTIGTTSRTVDIDYMEVQAQFGSSR